MDKEQLKKRKNMSKEDNSKGTTGKTGGKKIFNPPPQKNETENRNFK